MNSSFSSQNANYMSRKWELINRFSFEGPRVNGKFPNHFQPLSRGRCFEVLVLIVIGQFSYSHDLALVFHEAAIITSQ